MNEHRMKFTTHEWTQNEIYNSINEWDEHRMKFTTLLMNEMNTEWNVQLY